MTIHQLIDLVQARISFLSQLLSSAEKTGDLEAVLRLSSELTECQTTLAQLQGV